MSRTGSEFIQNRFWTLSRTGSGAVEPEPVLDITQNRFWMLSRTGSGAIEPEPVLSLSSTGSGYHPEPVLDQPTQNRF
jgi:hypothetical protein